MESGAQHLQRCNTSVMKINGTATAELIGVRAAARALKVSPSTVSRYLKDHPELNLGDETHPKIDVAALRRHRLENTNPARRGSWAGRLLGEGGGDGPASAAEPPPAATAPANQPNYAMAKAVRETVLAQRARVDLDEKRGLLVSRAEVEDAVFDAGTILQRDLLGLGPQLAERLAAMDDPREIAEVLETEYRRVLAALAASLRATAAAEGEPRAPGEGDTPSRAPA